VTAAYGPHRLGIDIGGSSVKTALIAEDDAVIGVATSEAYRTADERAVERAIRSCAERLGLPPESDVCVGIAAPGVLNPSRSAIASAVNLPGLVGIDLPELVRRSLPRARVNAVLPDAQAAAIGHWSERREPGRLLAMSLGTGVGAALLDDGIPVEMTDGGPGHLGQIDVGPCAGDFEPIGPDGGRNGLEAYIGGPALRARFGEHPLAALADLDENDPAMRAMVRAIRVCHALYCPDEIALLGGVGLALSPALGAVERLVRENLTAVARPGWRLSVGSGSELAARGAAIHGN